MKMFENDYVWFSQKGDRSAARTTFCITKNLREINPATKGASH